MAFEKLHELSEQVAPTLTGHRTSSHPTLKSPFQIGCNVALTLCERGVFKHFFKNIQIVLNVGFIKVTLRHLSYLRCIQGGKKRSHLRQVMPQHANRYLVIPASQRRLPSVRSSQ